MHAESIKNRRFYQPVPNSLSMKGGGHALCAVACDQADDCMAVCASQRELRRVSAKLLTIQESERQRIATDLHDGIGQSLTLIGLELDAVSGLLAANSLGEAEDSLRHMKSKVQATFNELRRVTMNLRPSTLDDLGILATLSWFFRELENACRNMKIERQFQIQEINIPVPLKITIFRILQEAVNNVVKHAQADRIRVSLAKVDEMLNLSIEDNGKGFDSAEGGNYCVLDKGLGLMSMEARANSTGGNYRIESAPGMGTRISVTWPCS